MLSVKTCKVCGKTLPTSEFYRNATFLDGVDSTCKACKRAYQSRWREANRDAHRAYSSKYQREHAEARMAYYAQWRAENAERKAAGDRQWRSNHPEKVMAMRKLQNARRRARAMRATGSFTPKEWLALKERYGNRCLICGRSEPEVKITPDHVVPLALGGSNSIGNIQPLCWGCNARKQARIADYRET